MKHCPRCFTEYEDWVERCNDCSMPLRPGAAHRPEDLTPVVCLDDLNDFVSVGTVETMFEAQTLKNVLVTEGILSVMLIPHGGASQDSFGALEKPWWDIRVSESNANQARELVELTKRDLSSAPPRPAQEEEEEEK